MAAKTTAKKKTSTSRKKTASGSAGASKTTSVRAKKKSANSAAKKSTRKSAAKKKTRKAGSAKAPARTSKKPTAKKPTFSSADISVVHVFSLRPRVNTAFRPEDFRTAKHRLRDENFASRDAAARAVVECAHELRSEKPKFHGAKN